MRNVFFLVFIVLCASSCVTVPPSSPSPVYVTNSKKIHLLPCDAIEKNMDVRQFLTGTYGRNDFSLMCYLKADENGIFLSVFNDFGTGLGNIVYDGKSVVFDTKVFPKNAKAEYIVSDLQFAYYSAIPLSAVLEEAGLFLSVEKNDGNGRGVNTEVRRIFDGNKLVEEIEIFSGGVNIKNYLRDYSYSLEYSEE